jgi:DNA invertase Pin-like site-specific DNA recombinase
VNSKITPEHLERAAYVYIRQSSQDQVRNRQESQRRQYALQDQARQLGWTKVVVIDEDQGRSGSGTARSGFDRLIAAVCEGCVGAVLALEVSRLARNGREWHTLMEFCGIVGTLVIDEHGVYDPRSTNDRLLLGVKSTLAEMELSTFRQRSQEAIKLKAARGEMYTSVAMGYVRNGGGLEKDPDIRVQQAIDLIFRKFAEYGSVRQVLMWHRQESICIPYILYSAEGRNLEWKQPVYNSLLAVLRNPIYAGAYVYGRSVSQTTLREGRKRIVRTGKNNRDQWRVLIRDHHEGYISWEVFEHNERVIAHNANMMGEQVSGSVRSGQALLGGLLRCGHCGRKLRVAYGGNQGIAGRYECRGTTIIEGASSCISFGASRVDEAVSDELLRRLQTLGIEAALHAIEMHQRADDDVRRHGELALEQARYEAALARRKYDAVDPLNRLVAAELERRWNERLLAVQRLEEQLATLSLETAEGFTEAERKHLLSLGADLPCVWHHPNASAETRKRILRTVVNEVVACVEGDQIRLKLHWQGGDHTALVVPRRRRGYHRFVTDTNTTELIRSLARSIPDASIAALLNRLGKRTVKGNTWNVVRVRAFRDDHDIDVYRDGERAERGEVNLEEAADLLQVHPMQILRLIRRRIVPAQQSCVGAPWSIHRSDLTSSNVQDALAVGMGSSPLTRDPNQTTLSFQ